MTHAATTTDEVRLFSAGGDLLKRLRRVEHLIEPAAARPEEDIEHVHRLRVATRRAEASVAISADRVPAALSRKITRLLRTVRRAAGPARDADVHGVFFAGMTPPETPAAREALGYVIARTADERRDAQAALSALLHDGVPGKIRALRHRLKETLAEVPGVAPGPAVRLAASGVEDAASADLAEIDNLHTLRKRAKALRYTLEILRTALPDEPSAALITEFRVLQDGLGALNDASTVLDRLLRYQEPDPDGPPVPTAVREGLRALSDQARRELHAMAEAAAATWHDPASLGVIDRARALVDEPLPPTVSSPVTLRAAGRALSPKPGTNPNRLAAIDIGTNSIRLIVAELDDAGSYRVLDDEKEITRLGAGLAQTGTMSPEAIERSVEAVARMRDIADGYGAGMLRAVGTAVVRDARNTSEFCDAVVRRAGIEVEVIGPEREAQLAFKSVSAAFDIGEQSIAIVDIGGGSTEVVMSSRGLIEAVYAVPLGAVRLTERFGGPEDASGKRFREMRSFLRAELKSIIGKPAFTPQLMIGTGGTLTTLAAVQAHQRQGPLFAQPGGVTVRGIEMQRSDLRHILDRLRKMSAAERAKVPGLPQDRADIIVAGVLIAESLMKRLGVNEARVHDRGIRDGLLLEMAEQARGGSAPAPPADPMRSVQHFAAACKYDHAHCEHTAGLALEMFDQLRAHAAQTDPPWTAALTDESRMILEAGAVLQDVGYHINYTRHHKHSHHLILHADLPGLTPRQTRMIANTARYHRRAEPNIKHDSFAALGAEDRATVRAIAGILRVAGGLDRAHVQRVTGVRLEFLPGVVRVYADAASNPHVELWGASRKAGLFESIFGATAEFAWSADGGPAPYDGGTHEPL